MAKKIILATVLTVASFSIINTIPQSCTAISSSPMGVSVIKSALLSSIKKAEKTYSSRQAFLQNDKVLTFLPTRLHTFYNGLQRFSPETANSLKNYLADVGIEGVKLAAPVLKNSVNRLTGEDIRRIMEGTPGTATQVLKEKAEAELVATLLPRIDTQLQQSGLAGIIDTAVRGGNLLGSVFGQSTSPDQVNRDLSSAVTHQVVEGIFLALKNYEVDNYSNLYLKK